MLLCCTLAFTLIGSSDELVPDRQSSARLYDATTCAASSSSAIVSTQSITARLNIMSGFAALAGDEGSASEIIQEKRRVAAEEQAQQEAREARQQERARAKFNDLKAKAGQMNWADSDEDSGYMSSPRVRAAARCPCASAGSAACLRRACAPGCLGACARALRCARAPPRPPAILVRAALRPRARAGIEGGDRHVRHHALKFDHAAAEVLGKHQEHVLRQ